MTSLLDYDTKRIHDKGNMLGEGEAPEGRQAECEGIWGEVTVLTKDRGIGILGTGEDEGEAIQMQA